MLKYRSLFYFLPSYRITMMHRLRRTLELYIFIQQ